MRRREFIGGLAGAAAFPLAARAQQPAGRKSRIGVLMPLSENDSEAQHRITAFVQSLSKLGWTVGNNVTIDYRWTSGSASELRKSADELAKIAPDMILAAGSAAVVQLLQVTRSVPILFVDVPNPVEAGIVANLSRPGGNVTGFARADMAASGLWLEMLKQIAAGVKSVAVLQDPTSPPSAAQLAAVRSTASALNIAVSAIDIRNAAAIPPEVAKFAGTPGGVLVVTESEAALRNRDLIIALAAEYKLPAVYTERLYPVAGGLLSVGPDLTEEYRSAAEYADRILKGDKPSEMPVRASVKIRLVINNKTAKTLGLAMPPALIQRADEVLE